METHFIKDVLKGTLVCCLFAIIICFSFHKIELREAEAAAKEKKFRFHCGDIVRLKSDSSRVLIRSRKIPRGLTADNIDSLRTPVYEVMSLKSYKIIKYLPQDLVFASMDTLQRSHPY